MTEREIASSEDPSFAEVQARALAKARGEDFNREKHMPPIVYKIAPRIEREQQQKAKPTQIDSAAILKRYAERTTSTGRQLRAEPRDFKREQSGDR